MTWLKDETSRSAYFHLLTDNYTFCEFTQYSKFSKKIRKGLHVIILRSTRDVQRLAGNPSTCCYLIERVDQVV
jgi:hypothetical protein